MDQSGSKWRRVMALLSRPGASFLAAGVAATAELLVMQPLDVVKTRMHLQGDGIKSGDNFQVGFQVG